MNSIAALSEGARQVLKIRRVLAFYYFVNLVASAAAIAPAAVLIRARLSHSLENDRLFPNLDISWIVETLQHFQWWPVTGIGATVMIVGILYLVLSTFLAGGACAVLYRPSEPFFSSCARYFPRLFRLLLISLVFYGLVMTLNGGVTRLLDKARESSMESRPWVIAHWIQLAVELLLLGLVNLWFDFGKVVCVAGNQRSAVRATWAAGRFVAARAGRALTIYWVCTGIGLAFLLAYHGLTEGIGQQSAFAVGVVFIIRQLYILTRMWLRLWTWSSALQLYAFNSTIVAPEPPSLAVAG